MGVHDFTIGLSLLSETTIGGSTDPSMGVDVELCLDEIGLPCMSGKSLKSLMRDAWLSMHSCFPALEQAAVDIFGVEAQLGSEPLLHIGDALLPEDVRNWIRYAREREHHRIAPNRILDTLAAVRYQTSEQRTTGAPKRTSLRSSRVLLKGLELVASATWMRPPSCDHLRCLAMSALATRHIGLVRNRGRGHVCVTLDGDREKTQATAKGA